MKFKTKDDKIEDLKYITGKLNFEKTTKPPKIDNEYYKKKYKILNKKKIILIITEIVVGGGSTITSSALSIFNPSAGFVISTRTDLLTSIALLIKNDYISNLKIR